MSSPLSHEKRAHQRKTSQWARAVMLSLSVLLCVAVSFCYWLRPDSCAAVTVLPTWVWLALGLVLTGLGWNRTGKRSFTVVAFLWLLFLLVFVEEARSLIRFRRLRRDGNALRVVSLNCAGGSKDAAAEVEQYRPDIVLLQESPSRNEVKDLARQLFKEDAGFVWGVDASIIARGKVVPVDLPVRLRTDFVQARVQLTSGVELEVISLRLLPGVVRMDLWSRSCWQAHAEHRRAQREQLQAVAQQIDAVPHTTPLIVSGDFNAPAGDAIFRLLQPRLHDAFKEGGTGWGNTILNDTPVLRIDQIWVSERFRAMAVVARRTKHSDHRMVVCDLVVK